MMWCSVQIKCYQFIGQKIISHNSTCNWICHFWFGLAIACLVYYKDLFSFFFFFERFHQVGGECALHFVTHLSSFDGRNKRENYYFVFFFSGLITFVSFHIGKREQYLQLSAPTPAPDDLCNQRNRENRKYIDDW